MKYKREFYSFSMEMLESTNAPECYICCDETEEKSPCICAAPVHMKCLIKWIEKNDNKRYSCSICHTELEGIRPAKMKSELIFKRHPYAGTGFLDCGQMGILLVKFIYFMMMGFIGKYLFAMMEHPQWVSDDLYWSPFDLLFLACACFGTMISTTVIVVLIKTWKYLSNSNDDNYEEFDNDSDDDYAV